MTMRATPLVALVTAGMMLGGCQSIFGKPFAAKAKAGTERVDMADYFAMRIEAGKQHLRQNRPAKAAVAFRQASHDLRYTADAYNGMGIAYAQMGRNDLAGKYLRLAIERNPEDQRYARNLARFEATVIPDILDEAERAFAKAELAPVEPEAKPAVETRQLASGSTISIGSAPTAQLTRVAQGVVRIGLPDPKPVQATTAGTQTSRPAVKVHHVRAITPTRSASPIRVGFGERKERSQTRPAIYAITSKPSEPAYPVRVAIAPKTTETKAD